MTRSRTGLLLALRYIALFYLIVAVHIPAHCQDHNELKSKDLGAFRTAIRTDHKKFNEEINIEKATVTAPIKITWSHIHGNLSFWECAFKNSITIDQSDIHSKYFRFKGCTFEKKYSCSVTSTHDSTGIALFNNALFKDTADFSASSFHGDASFVETEFNRIAYFTACNFKTQNFISAKFKDAADFEVAFFHKQANFTDARFSGSAIFKNSQFKKRADFQTCIFDSSANFESAQFHDEADFRKIKFKNGANFQYTVFGGLVSFSNTLFTKTVSFTHARINKIFLRNTNLPDTLYFNHLNQIDETIDFSLCKTDSLADRQCKINLVGTDISKIKLNYMQFKLFFLPTDDMEIRRNVYEQLIRVQRESGYAAGLEKLDSEYQELSYLNDNKYIINWIDKHWWGYGYKKERIFFNSFLLLALFSIINFIFFNKLLSLAYAMHGVSQKNRLIRIKRKQGLNPWRYHGQMLIRRKLFTKITLHWHISFWSTQPAYFVLHI